MAARQNADRRMWMPSVNWNKRLERNKRYFGHFHCHRCGNSWRSGNAFQKHYQKCDGCKRRTYPNKLKALSRPDGPSTGSEQPEIPERTALPHQSALCQRCIKLGKSCVQEPEGSHASVLELDCCASDPTCVQLQFIPVIETLARCALTVCRRRHRIGRHHGSAGGP